MGFAGGGEAEMHVHAASGVEVRESPVGESERARRAPGSSPPLYLRRACAGALLSERAVVGDPRRDQDDQVAPVLLFGAEAEQLADDRQAAQERDAATGSW